MNKKLVISAIVLILLTSCSEYLPGYERNFLTILNELETIIDSESTSIGYSKRYFNGRTEYYLVVTLVNTNNLPKNKFELRKLGAKAMKFAFSNINNESIYDKYEVVFENKKGLIIKKTFKATFSYNFDEIEKNNHE